MLPSSSYVRPRRLLGALPPPVGSPDGTVESDAVIILAALLCTLICVVGLGVMARCAWRCRTSNSESSSNSSSNKGLKKKALRAIPVAVISSVGEKLASDCAICLTEFVAGEKVRVLPVCGHCFHLPCIDTWLSAHSSCPSCRQILPENGSKAKPSVPTARRCERCGLPENCPPVISPGSGGGGGV